MLNIVIRTLILYVTVIASLRIMGKRQIGELQPSELMVAIMISDLASVPMQALDIPIAAGIIPVITLIVAEVLMSYLSLKNRRIRKFVSGEPSIVIYDGHVNEKEMARQRFNLHDLLEELRINNCHDISDVAVAIIETGGKLSVIPKDNARGATVEDIKGSKIRHDGLPCMVISDGQISTEELKRSKKSYEWLMASLKKEGIKSVKEVFIASVDAEGEIYIQKKGEEDKGV